jgi:small subunit ribosomal protein S14
MAKTCMIAREDRRRRLAINEKSKRDSLNQIIDDPNVDFDQKITAVEKLTQAKRDGSRTRQRTRCRVCGRPRGVYRKFGLCRVHLREAMMRGDVPGLVKASW